MNATRHRYRLKPPPGTPPDLKSDPYLVSCATLGDVGRGILDPLSTWTEPGGSGAISSPTIVGPGFRAVNAYDRWIWSGTLVPPCSLEMVFTLDDNTATFPSPYQIPDNGNGDFRFLQFQAHILNYGSNGSQVAGPDFIVNRAPIHHILDLDGTHATSYVNGKFYVQSNLTTGLSGVVVGGGAGGTGGFVNGVVLFVRLRNRLWGANAAGANADWYRCYQAPTTRRWLAPMVAAGMPWCVGDDFTFRGYCEA